MVEVLVMVLYNVKCDGIGGIGCNGDGYGGCCGGDGHDYDAVVVYGGSSFGGYGGRVAHHSHTFAFSPRNPIWTPRILTQCNCPASLLHTAAADECGCLSPATLYIHASYEALGGQAQESMALPRVLHQWNSVTLRGWPAPGAVCPGIRHV